MIVWADNKDLNTKKPNLTMLQDEESEKGEEYEKSVAPADVLNRVP